MVGVPGGERDVSRGMEVVEIERERESVREI